MLRRMSHVAYSFASYVKIPGDFPWGFFQTAGESGCVLEPLLPKCGGQVLSEKKTLGCYPVPARDPPLRNPRGSWEKLHIYLFSAHPKTIKPPPTGLAHCALPTTILFFHASLVDPRAP